LSKAAAQGRRNRRRQEWAEQVRLALLLNRYIDPSWAFWSSLENKPRSLISGLLGRKKGVRSGLPDVMVIPSCRPPVFVELKSAVGRASPTQKKIRAELAAVGCDWWMCRSANAAMTALERSGVPFRRPWRGRALRPWEGPFTGEEKRLPQHPETAARNREANRQWRAKQRVLGLLLGRRRPMTDERRGEGP
jgi:hypothetical protein